MEKNRFESHIKPFDASTFPMLMETGPNEFLARDLYDRLVHLILEEYEGFGSVERVPAFRGNPFDFIAFRDKDPYLITFRDPVNLFRIPSEVLKFRIRELLKRVERLNAALIQVYPRKGVYRAIYTEEITRLREIPGSRPRWDDKFIDPIVKWITERIIAWEQHKSQTPILHHA